MAIRSDWFIKYIDFSKESLETIDDIELIVLKIHIVIEGALQFLLAQRLSVQENFFNNKRLNFSTFLELALAGLNRPHLLGALRSLNNARILK